MKTNCNFQAFSLPIDVMSSLESKKYLPIITSTHKESGTIRCCTGCGGCCDDDCAAGNTVG